MHLLITSTCTLILQSSSLDGDQYNQKMANTILPIKSEIRYENRVQRGSKVR